MTDIYGPLERIIHELSVIHLDPVRHLQQDGQGLPSLIYAGSGGSIVTNEVIETEIQKVADWMLQQQPYARDKHSLKEWLSTTRAAFDPALAQLELSRTARENAKQLKVKIESRLDEYSVQHGSRGRSLGVDYFPNPQETHLR